MRVVLCNHWYRQMTQFISQIKRDNFKNLGEPIHFIGSAESKSAVSADYVNACDSWMDIPFITPEQYLREVQGTGCSIFFMYKHTEEIRLWLRLNPKFYHAGKFFFPDVINKNAGSKLHDAHARKGVKIVMTTVAMSEELFDDKFASTIWVGRNTSIPICPMLRLSNPQDLYEAYSGFGEGFVLKYLTDVGGKSYRRVYSVYPSVSLQDNNTAVLSFADLLQVYSVSQKPLLAMPYLDGPEVSLDCLASGDKFLCIQRTKLSSDVQEIGCSSEYMEYAASFARATKIQGPFNLQFRQYLGHPVFLECNLRIAGGSYKDDWWGVSYPYQVYRWACGEHLQLIDENAAPVKIQRKTEYILLQDISENVQEV